jgi:hypothetical protein
MVRLIACDDNRSEDPRQGEGRKKDYYKPELVRLGTLRELTLSNTGGGNRDGGTHGASKFTGRGGHFRIDPT